MFDRLIYENLVRSLTDVAVAGNASQRHDWELRKAAWLDLAAIERASNLKNPGSWAVPEPPLPPAMLLWVEAPPWTEGASQSSVKLNLGPERVADPTCELPPLPGPNPPGNVVVGAHNWGGIWAVGDGDTMPPGAVIPWPACKTAGCNALERVISWGFSTQSRGYYQEVKV